MQIVRIITRSETFTLTDSEFQKIKDKAPSLVSNRSKEVFVDFINNDPNNFALDVLDTVDENTKLPVPIISNPLYAFFHELAATSKNTTLNPRLLSDSNRIEELIHNLKTVQRTNGTRAIPLLNGSASTKTFIDVAHALFTSKKLVCSLFPKALVMEFNGKLRDYSEEEFQEHFVATANFIIQASNQFSNPDITESRKKALEESGNPLYKFTHLLLANSKFCSHENILPNDDIISDYESIKIVLKDLKEKTRTTKEGRELPKLHHSINELQFIRVLKKVCNEEKMRCTSTPDKLFNLVTGVKKEVGELTFVNHIVKELNKLALETPQYPPSAHTSTTSLSSSSSSASSTAPVAPPAVAAVVLGTHFSDISRI